MHSLRGAFGLGRSARTKVMPLLLLAVMVLPALLIAAIAIFTNDDKLPLEYTAYAVHLQVIVSIFVASQAPQSVSRDLRYRVVALYFSRPLSRHAYVQAKLLALSAALFLLLAMPLLVLYGGALLAQMPFWHNTRGVLVGLAGAVVFAVVLASIGLVIAAFTPRRGLGRRRGRRGAARARGRVRHDPGHRRPPGQLHDRGLRRAHLAVHARRRCADVGLRREVIDDLPPRPAPPAASCSCS